MRPDGSAHNRGVAALTRRECAELLGVPPDADAESVRRAWRMWAGLLHPDRGGDPAAFAAMHRAYRCLLAAAEPDITRVAPAPAPPRRAASTRVPREPDHAPAQRPGLRTVLRRRNLLVAVTVMAGLLGAAAAVGPLVGSTLLSAMLPAAALCALVVAAPAHCLEPSADDAHRASLASVAWVSATGIQLAASTAVGASLVPYLPLLALPLIAYTSIVLFPGGPLFRR